MTNKSGENDTGIIFNIQRFSIHDGPGIRTTVFLKGCPLRCKWCSNPEGMSRTQEIFIHDEKCIQCGKCKEACPEDAIISLEGTKRIDFEKCTHCMECARACPTNTLESVGEYVSINEIVEEVKKDALFYDNSGGGVTLSGGEPLLQWNFTTGLLKSCKEQGLHTALDTTGFASWEIMREVLKHVDLVLYDVKHMDESLHIQGTGVSNKTILENLEKTASIKKTWLRFPIIPGFNDSHENVEKLAYLGAKLGVEKVSLLPYHEWGRHKYKWLGRDYPLLFHAMISDDELEKIKTVFEEKGLNVTLNR